MKNPEYSMRVLSGRGLQRALGFQQDSGRRLKLFIEKSNIKPYVEAEINLEINSPRRRCESLRETDILIPLK